jgi:acetyltransferase-like isoleucine patch superfamily enzyme
MKNAGLPDNTIVAAKSVVSKKFTESNTVVGGNPARVVKTGVNWDRRIHAEIDSIESAK